MILRAACQDCMWDEEGLLLSVLIGLSWPNKGGVKFIRLPEHHVAAGCVKVKPIAVRILKKRLRTLLRNH